MVVRGVDNGCRRERKREGEKGKAGMHESLKSQPRSRERAGGDKGGGCACAKSLIEKEQRSEQGEW